MVKKHNKEPSKLTEEKRPKGHPRAFETEQVFIDKFKRYINHCVENKRFPNIAGFCAFTDITRDTFYAQQEYYSDSYNKARQMLEDEVWQDNTYRAQLYLKSVFGYTDKQVIESTNVNLNADLSEDEADKIISKWKDEL